MPLLAGSVTCRRYRLLESPPDDYLQTFGRAIARHAFRPIDPDKGDAQSGGWVSVRNILETRLGAAEWHMPPFLVLGYRLDRKAVPARLLRARVEQAVVEKLRGARQKISREERAALETTVKQEMLRAQSPTISITEVAWNIETGRVVVGSTASTVNDAIVALFTDTFGLTPVPLYPYILAEAWAEKRKRQAQFARATATDFAAGLRDRVHPAHTARVLEAAAPDAAEEM